MKKILRLLGFRIFWGVIEPDGSWHFSGYIGVPYLYGNHGAAEDGAWACKGRVVTIIAWSSPIKFYKGGLR